MRTGKYTHLLATRVTRPTNVAGGGRIIHGIYSDLLQGVRREPKIALSSLQVGSNFYVRDTPPLAAEGGGGGERWGRGRECLTQTCSGQEKDGEPPEEKVHLPLFLDARHHVTQQGQDAERHGPGLEHLRYL